MIEAIWPSYANIPNTIVASGTTTQAFVSFFLFWLCSLPAIWFPVHQIRHLFTVKAVYTPIAMIAFFAWTIHKAHGIGPIINQPSSLHGSDLAWAVIKGIMSSIANFATLIVNDPDFSRFAKTNTSALWSQLISIPLAFAITSFIGIIASSSSTVLYGETIWSPLELLGRFLEGASSGERFGVFIIALGFALAQLGTNIAANSVSAGTDMTALFPRFLNIRRGGYICAAVGLAMCPWKLASSSNNFTTYLSAYAVFLSSIAAVIITDYYFVRRGYLDVRELYSARKRSPYYFTYGVSWRAFAAYISGILINIVGFAGACGATVPIGAQYIYNVDYIAGFVVSSVVYYLLCRLFPITATSPVWNEVDVDVDHLTVAYGQEVVNDEETRSDPEEDTLAYNKKDNSQGYATF
jgi:nucleobase:cation symporter-1, NCS1 family